MKHKYLIPILFATLTLSSCSLFINVPSSSNKGNPSSNPSSSHSHDYKEQIVTEEYLKSPADCTHKAVYYYSCSCGAKGADTFEYGEPLNHNYEVAGIEEATFDSEEMTIYTCSRCGDTYKIKTGDKKKSTVIWKNYDGTVLETDTEVNYGDMPYYDGLTPVREKDENNTYIFNGWSPSPSTVTGDVTYTATYEAIEKENWTLVDGSAFGVYYRVKYNLSKRGYEISTSTYNYTDLYGGYASMNNLLSFSGYSNKNQLVELYFRILASGLIFQFESDVTLTDNNAFNIDTTSLDLSLTDIRSVMAAVINDWPLLYWLDGGFTHWTSGSDIVSFSPWTEIYFYTPSARASYNSTVLTGLSTLIEAVSDIDDRFETLTNIHKYIIDHTDYAYVSPGVPSTDIKAHSILGFFLGENVVCEGYAKVTLMALNKLGIENYYVTGDAGERHAWNYVKYLGKWYMLDVTWDDQATMSIRYFLTSLDDRVPDPHTLGSNYQCELPSVYDHPYVYTELYKGESLLGSYYCLEEALSAISGEGYRILLSNKGFTLCNISSWPAADGLIIEGGLYRPLYDFVIGSSVTFKKAAFVSYGEAHNMVTGTHTVTFDECSGRTAISITDDPSKSDPISGSHLIFHWCSMNIDGLVKAHDIDTIYDNYYINPLSVLFPGGYRGTVNETVELRP